MVLHPLQAHLHPASAPVVRLEQEENFHHPHLLVPGPAVPERRAEVYSQAPVEQERLVEV